MTTASTPPRSLPLPLRLLIAPLLWVERARGRRRSALIALYVVALLIAGVLSWRQFNLRHLPDVGEPFDIAAFEARTVPDAENAFLRYRDAMSQFKPIDSKAVRANPKIGKETDWGRADPELRRWVEDNREALALWLEGAERPQALAVPLKEMAVNTNLAAVQHLREFARLALLEGSRREQEGDMAGAWALYRALLRSSRHAGMNGGAIQRLIGLALLGQAGPRVTTWAEDPRVDATLLRRAIDDMAACQAMTPPNSDMAKVEYLITRKMLAEPHRWKQWGINALSDPTRAYNHFPYAVEVKLFLRREPERSQRIARLVYAQYLAQCDRPPEQRAKLVDPEFMIYATDPSAPPAARALSPEALRDWTKSSLFSSVFAPLSTVQGRFDGERLAFDLIRLNLAEQCYRREHGALPKTYGDLVGPYLKELPEGYDPADVPARPEPEGRSDTAKQP
ncbi:MAG: hypothetical protein IRY99_10030 [Isosphaeraceae bacterium]|nr:hypothetical protein [Isosphaeraceae bacterium]